MVIRLARPADVADLVAVSRSAFTEAFGHLYSPENLERFLAEWRSPERVAASIADPETRVAIAEDNGSILGYCITVYGKGFSERPAPRPARPAYLGQLYCTQAATGRGIGAALIEDSLAEARRRACDAVQLSVWSENAGAQRFYARYGFQKVADIDFWVGDHRDDEYLLELTL